MKNIRTSHIIGLKILFGSNYWLWEYDETKLSFITPYFLSKQMAKMANMIYSNEYKMGRDNNLMIWDMFGGIGTDSINLSKYFNVISTEINKEICDIFMENVRNFKMHNINVINDNCISMMNVIKPDVIYYDPPWGDTYNNRIKNFDFGQVYIDYPSSKDNEKDDLLNELPKKINCIDLLKYIYNNITSNIVIKSPINSNTFERVFQSNIKYIHKCTTKNLKFIYLIK